MKATRSKGRRGRASASKRRLSSPAPDLVLTVAEAAVLLRVSETTIVRAIHTGKLPSFTLARRLLIPRDALAGAFRVKDPL